LLGPRGVPQDLERVRWKEKTMRDDASRQIDDLRRALASILGVYLARLLDSRGVSDQETEDDFRRHRRGRR
jgi:hypothetical protein